MVITLDLSTCSFNECPEWYRNIIHETLRMNIDLNTTQFEDVVGFAVSLENYVRSSHSVVREITGEETEITAMILKWS